MSSARILVVDDDPDFVEIMRTILESNDYQVVTAANGNQALSQVKLCAPTDNSRYHDVYGARWPGRQ
jgi:CheY-like chemotaxis protein